MRKIYLALFLLLLSIAVVEGTEQDTIALPILWWEVEISSAMSILLLGIILGLVDGMNPCIVAVFLFLVAYLLGTGEKKKVLQIGFTFVATVFVLYFLFMIGLFTFLDVLFIREEIFPFVSIKNIVAFIIIFVGLVMIKDFFWLGKGFSLKIPESAKPTISKLAKGASIPSAIGLAAFSTLAGIPCTSGLPICYTCVMAERGITPPISTAYILWYNIFHIVPLLVLISLFYWANMKAKRAEEWRLKSRKYMKLISGSLMFILGLLLLLGQI